MNFQGFSHTDFETFKIDGLDHRMEAIQDRIQPKFKEIGKELTDYLSVLAGNEMFLHIARHARRTVNPPKDTWLAICNDKRGYKKHPHFQVGLFDDHLFIWLAYIYELPNKKEMAKSLLNKIDLIQSVPKDYVISLDHMNKESLPIRNLDELEINQALKRFRDVKKGEFLIGRHIEASNPLLEDGEKLLKLIKDTYKTLMPIYKLSYV